MTFSQKTLFLLALAASFILKINAQNSDFRAQFSVLPGLSTNGDSAIYYTNTLSFNLFGGVNGGVDGLEFSCFSNVLKQNLRGAQISGITNIVEGESTALQAAGIFNYTGKSFQGFQLGGVANITIEEFTGLQGAGIFNLSDRVYGAQLSGITGTCSDLYGIQVNGLGGVAENVTGAQISGIVNHSKSIRGIQVAGLVNQTQKLEGIQLGFINISDTVSAGIPIGFLSFSKSGYQTLDLSYNDVFPLSLAFKTGVDAFYNVLLLSSNFDSQEHLWAFGYGIGSRFHLSKKSLLEFEATASHISQNEFEDQLNLLGRFNMNLAFQFGRFGEIYAGPSFNFYATQVYNTDNDKYGYAIAPPNLIYEELIHDLDKPTLLQAWLGFQVGLRL